jgi:hypothetical protein
MYKHKEVEARISQMPLVLRGLVEEIIRRGEQFEHRIPVEEAFDSDLASQLRLVLSVPAYRREWADFWQAHSDACLEDAAAIRRGEHDHEL